MISTAINASLYPIVSAYVTKLADVLRRAGYRNELLIANCVGGMMPPDEIIRRPIYSVMSGPTLAPIAGMHLTTAENVIVVDMGGTTFDVSALRDRQLRRHARGHLRHGDAGHSQGRRALGRRRRRQHRLGRSRRAAPRRPA